jgi:hypothetical protein
MGALPVGAWSRLRLLRNRKVLGKGRATFQKMHLCRLAWAPSPRWILCCTHSTPCETGLSRESPVGVPMGPASALHMVRAATAISLPVADWAARDGLASKWASLRPAGLQPAGSRARFVAFVQVGNLASSAFVRHNWQEQKCPSCRDPDVASGRLSGKIRHYRTQRRTAWGEGAVHWCQACLPPTPTGARISLEHIEQATGMTLAQPHALWKEL